MKNKNQSIKPLITTIIPTYRRPRLLSRAIKNVLNQTYPNFQICVYDNASNDETRSIVLELGKEDSRLKYYCHSENIGALANFNYGLLHVQTPFFSILSDDDIVLPHFYQTALEGFEKYPNAIFSAGSVISMTDKGQVLSNQLSSWPREGYFSAPDGLFQMLGMQHPTWTGVLFRKEVIDEIGILDSEVGLLADMDYELRIAARFGFVISKKPCAIWMAHPSSSCAVTNFKLGSFWPGWLKIIANLYEDDRIEIETRKYAESHLTHQIQQILYTTRFIINRQFTDSYLAAEILGRNYNQKQKAKRLYLFTKLCEFIPPAYYLLLCRDRARNVAKRRQNRHVQQQLGSYAKFLNL